MMFLLQNLHFIPKACIQPQSCLMMVNKTKQDSFASMVRGLLLEWSVKGYSLDFKLNYFSFCSHPLLCNFCFFKTTKDSV